MQQIYRVRSTEHLHPSDPLHVGHFYPDIQRHHFRKMEDRQGLILHLANIHAAALKSGMPLGLCRIPMRLMTLKKWVYDYKRVFDHFFTIVQHGYNLPDEHDISIVIPKKIETPVREATRIVYAPDPKPKGNFVESTVYVRKHARNVILDRLAKSGRLDLIAPVEWILEMPLLKILFAPSGKLQQRDTSVWPVPALETWPSWLRVMLFGDGIDIESAYTQFLITNVREAYAAEPHQVERFFPDLISSLDKKHEWRTHISVDILGLPPTEENISLVKKICMSLANGSRISPAIMLSGRSVTKDMILDRIENTTPSNILRIGTELEKIGRQYAHARKVVCNHCLRLNSTRANQKGVFLSYFKWEREARYKIWEAVGRHGIMVHDGIDGIPAEYLQDIPALVQSLNLKLST